MADDPNRDILPVRECSYVDTCRSSIDPRERHLVYKLDRYELEDKYLRLLEEARNLKKLSNCQEDKIKRLATKLMRVTASPRACNVALEVYDDKNRIIALELENSKLRDKISVLRNQLLSHKINGRSSSRSHNPQARSSSGRITCRSESSRTKIPSCHCITETGDDDNDAPNNLDKIEKFDAEKKEMASRIAELEKELSNYTATSQRVKVAENVEYIKVWRQMKQLNDKLIAAEATNKSLNAEIDDLKWKLEEATKKNYELTASLAAERKRLTEMDEQLLKAKESGFSLREKDEQINGLMNEMKILQQHNSELVDLTSKRGEVEQENMELKKKISEQLRNQETLKNAFNSEQTNIVALRASNEQLLGKLQELQKNIDFLTVQFTSFQTQTEKQETSKTTQISTKQTDTKNPQTTDKVESYKNTSSQMERCKKCCEAFERILQLEENICVPRGNTNPVDKSVQTEFITRLGTVVTKDQETSVMAALKEKQAEAEPVKETGTKNIEQMSIENPLTPGKMLRLLEQAQISNPSDSMRFAQKNITNSVDYNMVELNQRHSDTETLVQANQASRVPQPRYQQQRSNTNESTIQSLECQFTDPNKILFILFNILQGYSQTHPVSNETNLHHTVSSFDYKFLKDNVSTKSPRAKSTYTSFEFDASNKNVVSGCNMRRSCLYPRNKQRPEKLRRRIVWDKKKSNQMIKFDEANVCTCNSSLKCNVNSSCGQRCCNSSSLKSIVEDASTNASKSLKSILDTSDENHVSQKSEPDVSITDDGEINSRKAGVEQTFSRDGKDPLDDESSLQEYIEQLGKCKELVNQSSLRNAPGIPTMYQDFNDESTPTAQRTESYCSLNCPNECIDTLSSVSDPFPLVIPEGQGLLELHIVSLQLSTCAKQILFRENDINNVSLFVSWDIWNQETTYTPTQKCPKLNFNSSFVYRISDLFSFFNYVLLELVVFQANVYHEDKDSYTVARGKLCIKDILDYPQNKLHYIAPVNSVIPCSLGMNFGQLSLWVRLSCDVEKVDRFKKTRGLLTEYHEAPVQYPVVLDQPVTEKPVRVTLPKKDDVKVLKDPNSRARLLFEPSKEIVPHFQSPETRNESSDTTDAQDTNTERTFSKVPLTVVKESEDEHHFQSSYENATHPLQIQKSSKVDDKIKPEDSPISMSKWDFETSLKPVEAIDRRGRMVERNSIENHRSSVEEFNAVISKSRVNIVEPKIGVTQGGSDESFSEVTNVISEKNWEEYKQRSLLTFADTQSDTGSVKPISEAGFTTDSTRTSISQLISSKHEADTISIDILNMILFPKSSVMQNNEIHLLYIEYCFLGYSGADMETISAEKPRPPDTKLTYNFRRKFHVDEETHSKQNGMLRAMLDDTTNPNIRFIVVSEPLPEETDTKECVEVGFANFNLKEYAFGDIEKVVSVPVFSPDELEQIGLLKVYVSGIDTIRQRLGRRESAL